MDSDDDERLTACPHCGGSLLENWWRDAPDSKVIDWLAGGHGIGISEPPPRSERIRIERLFDEVHLRRLNQRIRLHGRDRMNEVRNRHYEAAISAPRAAFAPPDELAFVPPRARQLLARFGIDTLDELLRYSRGACALMVGFGYTHAIQQALRKHGLKLRKR